MGNEKPAIMKFQFEPNNTVSAKSWKTNVRNTKSGRTYSFLNPLHDCLAFSIASSFSIVEEIVITAYKLLLIF